MQIEFEKYKNFIEKVLGKEALFKSFEEEEIKIFLLDNICHLKRLSSDLRSYNLLLLLHYVGSEAIYDQPEKWLKEMIYKIKIKSGKESVFVYKSSGNYNCFFTFQSKEVLLLIKNVLTKEEKKEWIRTALNPFNISTYDFLKTHPYWFNYFSKDLSCSIIETLFSNNKEALKKVVNKETTNYLFELLNKAIKKNKQELLKNKNESTIGNLLFFGEDIFDENDKYLLMSNIFLSYKEILKIDFKFSILFDTLNAMEWQETWKNFSKNNENFFNEEKILFLNGTKLKENNKNKIDPLEITKYLNKLGIQIIIEKETGLTLFNQSKKNLFKLIKIKENTKEEIELKSNIFFKKYTLDYMFFFNLLPMSIKIKLLNDFPESFKIKYSGKSILSILPINSPLNILIDYIIYSNEDLTITNENYDLLLLLNKS